MSIPKITLTTVILAGGQGTQRKLQRSVREMRKSCSGRERVSSKTPEGETDAMPLFQGSRD